MESSEGGVELCHRKYKKVLVINQHEFYTGEKSELIQEIGTDVAYTTVFSVKSDCNKLADHSRGWINLAGLKASIKKEHEEEASTSLD